MEKIKISVEQVKEVVAVLTDEERQLLKDTINYGCWGDGEERFLKSPNVMGDYEEVGMMGYCTNDAVSGGHFKGRVIATMFRSIYNKLCQDKGRIGHIISHCSDWWGDGSGDMLFIREG